MVVQVFSDMTENIKGKGENAGFQHFLLFPQCLQKASFLEPLRDVIVREWVKQDDTLTFGNEIVMLQRQKHTEMEKMLVSIISSFSKNNFKSLHHHLVTITRRP